MYSVSDSGIPTRQTWCHKCGTVFNSVRSVVFCPTCEQTRNIQESLKNANQTQPVKTIVIDNSAEISSLRGNVTILKDELQNVLSSVKENEKRHAKELESMQVSAREAYDRGYDFYPYEYNEDYNEHEVTPTVNYFTNTVYVSSEGPYRNRFLNKSFRKGALSFLREMMDSVNFNKYNNDVAIPKLKSFFTKDFRKVLHDHKFSGYNEMIEFTLSNLRVDLPIMKDGIEIGNVILDSEDHTFKINVSVDEKNGKLLINDFKCNIGESLKEHEFLNNVLHITHEEENENKENCLKRLRQIKDAIKEEEDRKKRWESEERKEKLFSFFRVILAIVIGVIILAALMWPITVPWLLFHIYDTM